MKKQLQLSMILCLGVCANAFSAADLVGYQQAGQDAYFFKAYDASTQALLTQVRWGQQIQIKYILKNIGNMPAGAFHVNFYLSNDAVIGDADDYKLGYAYWNTGLAAGLPLKKVSPTLTVPTTIPTGFSEVSTLYIGMKIDPNNKVVEASETNNYNQATGTDKRNITQASRNISDNFNDNVRNAMWSPIFEDSARCWLAESNGRLEVRATSGSTIQRGASFVGNGFRIIPTRDFSISFNYNHSLASTNETGAYCGFLPSVISGDTKNISLGVDRDPSCVFWYSILKGDGSSEDYGDMPAATSGKVYLSYSASLDELYLSNTGTGAANSKKTVKGVLKGIWASKPLYFFIGGDTYNATIGSGQVYVDNFSCTGLLGVCKPYSYTDDFADGAVASFWTKIQDSGCQFVETGGKLQFTSSATSVKDGGYLSKTYLDPSRDFMCWVDFTQSTTNTSGDTAVWIGIATSTLTDKLTFCADRDSNVKYFGYYLEGTVTQENWVARSATSGKLYISYSAAVDEVYLSYTGPGKAEALWTIKGAVKGKWGSKPIAVAIGGWSDGVLVPATKATLDNFMVIGEKK